MRQCAHKGMVIYEAELSQVHTGAHGVQDEKSRWNTATPDARSPAFFVFFPERASECSYGDLSIYCCGAADTACTAQDTMWCTCTQICGVTTASNDTPKFVPSQYPSTAGQSKKDYASWDDDGSHTIAPISHLLRRVTFVAHSWVIQVFHFLIHPLDEDASVRILPIQVFCM